MRGKELKAIKMWHQMVQNNQLPPYKFEEMVERNGWTKIAEKYFDSLLVTK
jgi:hypothetical protein